jgi:hypothetical protein
MKKVSDDGLCVSVNRAALGGHSYICQTLIKYGVDPNIRDYSGYGEMLIIIQAYELLRVWLNLNYNPNICNYSGYG